MRGGLALILEKELTVMAPGHKILSTSIDGNYTIRSGTSLAEASCCRRPSITLKL